MGLKEKRWFKQIEQEFLPQAQQTLDQVSGKTIALAIDWSTFNVVEQIQMIPTLCLSRLAMAFTELCDTPDGKRFIADNIDEIVIKNITDDVKNTKRLSVSNKIFTLEVGFSEYADGSFSDYAISEFLQGIEPEKVNTRAKIKLPYAPTGRVKIVLKK